MYQSIVVYIKIKIKIRKPTLSESYLSTWWDIIKKESFIGG